MTCECTGLMDAFTPFGSTVRTFGLPTEVTFLVNANGFVALSDMEGWKGKCNEVNKIEHDAEARCFSKKTGDSKLTAGNCLWQEDAAMIVDDKLADVKHIRCKNSAGEKVGYFKIPVKHDSPNMEYQFSSIEKCEAWVYDANSEGSRRAWCRWEGKYQPGVVPPLTQKPMSDACLKAVPNSGWFNGQTAFEVGYYVIEGLKPNSQELVERITQREGLAYHKSKKEEDIDESIQPERWGQTLYGFSDGDGWLQVSKNGQTRFVQTHVKNNPVLKVRDVSLSCGYNMKFEKCFDRLNYKYIIGDAHPAPLS